MLVSRASVSWFQLWWTTWLRFVCVSLCVSVAKINLLQRKTILLSEGPTRKIFEASPLRSPCLRVNILVSEFHFHRVYIDLLMHCL